MTRSPGPLPQTVTPDAQIDRAVQALVALIARQVAREDLRAVSEEDAPDDDQTPEAD